jgi:hypothetical protein
MSPGVIAENFDPVAYQVLPFDKDDIAHTESSLQPSHVVSVEEPIFRATLVEFFNDV